MIELTVQFVTGSVQLTGVYQLETGLRVGGVTGWKRNQSELLAGKEKKRKERKEKKRKEKRKKRKEKKRKKSLRNHSEFPEKKRKEKKEITQKSLRVPRKEKKRKERNHSEITQSSQ